MVVSLRPRPDHAKTSLPQSIHHRGGAGHIAAKSAPALAAGAKRRRNSKPWKNDARAFPPRGAGDSRTRMNDFGESAPKADVIRRHSVAVRLTHWINLLCLTLLLMSGLALFNFHPALYWGHYGYRGVPFFIGVGSKTEPTTGQAIGMTRIAGVDFETTGLLGVSYD